MLLVEGELLPQPLLPATEMVLLTAEPENETTIEPVFAPDVMV